MWQESQEKESELAKETNKTVLGNTNQGSFWKWKNLGK